MNYKKLGNYIEALEVEPADLFDVWTDEGWEKFTKESGADVV